MSVAPTSTARQPNVNDTVRRESGKGVANGKREKTHASWGATARGCTRRENRTQSSVPARPVAAVPGRAQGGKNRHTSVRASWRRSLFHGKGTRGFNAVGYTSRCVATLAQRLPFGAGVVHPMDAAPNWWMHASSMNIREGSMS